MGFLLSPMGRVSRRGLWLGYFLTFALLGAGAWYGDKYLATNHPFVLPEGLVLLQPALDIVGGPLVLALLVIFPWVTIVMLIKRLHDRGFGGLMLVWKLVMLGALLAFAWNADRLLGDEVGAIAAIVALAVAGLMVLRTLIIVLFLAGQDGENRYGANPVEN